MFRQTEKALPLSLLLPALWWLGYAFFCYLMLEITLQYIPPANDVAFLRIKQDVTQHWYYLPAFFVHAYTAILVLPAGFTQFSARLRRRFPALHRQMGHLYIWAVLLAAGPTGLIIGLHANGGWWSQLAFCLLAVLWLVFTALAWQKARQKRWAAHRCWMLRSFALAFSAITLRAWKYVLVALFHPPPMDVYRWVAWLGWVLNLAAVELFILYRIKK